MNGPTVARAVAVECADSLRKAIAGLAMLTRENLRLRAEIAERDSRVAERDSMIKTLQEMLNRAHT